MGDIEKFLALDIKNGFMFLAAVLVIMVVLIKNIDFLAEKLGIKTRRMLEEEEQNKTIDKLKGHADKTDEKIDKVVECLQKLQLAVDNISDQVGEVQKRNDENEAAVLKDRIAQMYRYIRTKGSITSIEKESIEDLIKAYSRYSSNSFVHSIIEPEIYKLQVIDE